MQVCLDNANEDSGYNGLNKSDLIILIESQNHKEGIIFVMPSLISASGEVILLLHKKHTHKNVKNIVGIQWAK